jgi:hypothetical protein
VKGIPFPSSISIDDARKIGLKVPKNHRGGKIQLCPLETEDTNRRHKDWLPRVSL